MCSSVRTELSQMRHLLVNKRNEIFDELSNRKSIGKKQCQQWIDELVDLVITYDNKHDSQHLEPIIENIDKNESKRKFDNSCDDILATDETIDKEVSPLKRTRSKTIANIVSNESKETDNKTDNTLTAISGNNQSVDSNEENEEKGVKYGLQTIHTIEDLPKDSDPDFIYKKKKNQKKKQNKKKTIEEKKPVMELSEVKVLGGGEMCSTENPSREMLAKVAEERKARMESRGSKGVVKLPKLNDRSDFPQNYNNSNTGLKWTV